MAPKILHVVPNEVENMAQSSFWMGHAQNGRSLATMPLVSVYLFGAKLYHNIIQYILKFHTLTVKKRSKCL
jgi:hypothetical protein